MRKRYFVILCFVALAALGAEQDTGPPAADRLDRELSVGQSVATIAGEGASAIVVLGGLLWRPWRARRRRLARDRLERQAMIEAQHRSAEDRRIDERIASALLLFRKTVMDPEANATLSALKTTLDTHTRDAQSQIQQVSGTVETLARGVAEIATRMERTATQTNERIDDFLRAMAVGNIPHFRAAPRPLDETQG